MSTETTAITRQSGLASGCAGCWVYMGFAGVVIVFIIAIIWAAPDTPPPLLNDFGHYGIMVSERQRTYLELSPIEYCEGCTPQAGQVMYLYYTQLGGWFQSSKRVLLYSQEEYNDSDMIQFARLNNTPSSPIKVWIPANAKGKGKGHFIFTPPATFHQAQSMKPIIHLDDNEKAR
ncbi:hypothetical protein JAO73_09275 [Hymenobacter sp. BT523]|uniref:hypothetical protein n=1 Tax=Hymenobacter sp. BT523 TaxID=2795725 RepID=UPI0018ECD892|nr:hypothetical protein [Hymenobacter sp. BT523]MBJ6109201.1 hypothetical protein [Hymenobacter sp. BT523]